MGWGDRLCVMNLFLHGIGGDDSPIVVGDALISDPGERFEFVLTNPPFGKKSSITGNPWPWVNGLRTLIARH
jgi:type I restriction-modification system DNA methylase subunit